MAVMATDAWTARSRSKGMARYVGHLLCDYVNQSRAEAGYDWEAWPSQGTLAKKANCSSRAIRRALAELKRIGEIEDTGRFKGRGCRVYAITLPEPTPDGSVQGEESPPRTEVSGVDGSVQGEGVKSGQVGRDRPPGRTEAPGGRTEVSGGADGSVRAGRTEASTEPEGNPEQEPEEEPEGEHGSGASLPDVLSSSSPPTSLANNSGPALADDRTPEQQHVGKGRQALDQAEELAALQAQLPTTTGSLREATERCIAKLEAELADAAELADQAGVELREATA